MNFCKMSIKKGRLIVIMILLLATLAGDNVWGIHCNLASIYHKRKRPTIEEMETKIERLRESIQRFEHQIRFYEFKISLHNECRGCHANCRPQGTGACRHYWRGEFDGRMHRASHQLPRHGKKRYDGINRAVSALQLRIDGCRRNITRLEERISKLEEKIRELESDSDD